MVRLFQILEFFFSFACVRLALNCLVMASDFTTFGLVYLSCALLALLCFVLMLVSRLRTIRVRSQAFRAGGGAFQVEPRRFGVGSFYSRKEMAG